MSQELRIPQEDKQEFERLKALLQRKPALAMDFQLPDERFLRPNKEHKHYDLHRTEETGMTVIDTYHFKTEDAIRSALQHIKTKLPPRIDESENSETPEENAPPVGGEAQRSEKDLAKHTPPGAS